MNVKPNRQKIQISKNDAPIILVVEDEEDNLLLISHALIFLKYNFITASKGQDALDLATQYKIDLILLDLVLPDMNGLELVNLLRQNQSTQDLPIIAISALVRQQDHKRALAAGCDDYLDKPYLIDDLKYKISQFIPKSFLSYKPSFFEAISKIISCKKINWNYQQKNA